MVNGAKESAISRLHTAAAFVNLVHVFVDDFVGATNNSDKSHLQHFSRAMLYGVHSIFPPPDVSGHHGQDPISQKKMDQGNGTWSTMKEILGWLVDGANFTIQLTPDKCEKLQDWSKRFAKPNFAQSKIPRTSWKVATCILWNTRGEGSFLAYPQSTKYIREANLYYSCSTVGTTRLVNPGPAPRQIPTPVQLLITKYPNFLQYTDACKLGAGGVIRVWKWFNIGFGSMSGRPSSWLAGPRTCGSRPHI